MRLSHEDVKLFYKLNMSLLVFVNNQLNIFKNVRTVEDFNELDFNDKVKIRDALYDNIQLLKKFYEENPANLTEKELSIVLGWKNFLQGKFWVYKQYKKHCVFLDDENEKKAYGVLSLIDDFADMVPDFPAYVHTVLLPFKNHIIYDGVMGGYPVYFGSGIRGSIKDEYDKAKALYGIIEQLPFKTPPKAERDAGLLRYYLKDEANRDFYYDEIYDLVEKNAALKAVYYEEIGKINSRLLKKRLKAKGVNKCWFAVLEDVIVASGKDEKEARQNAEKILPQNMKPFLYLFKM